MQGSVVLHAAQNVEESVVRFLRADEEGRRASKRPLRRLSGTPPSMRDESSRCQREKTACGACSNPVGSGKFDTGVNVLGAAGL